MTNVEKLISELSGKNKDDYLIKIQKSSKYEPNYNYAYYLADIVDDANSASMINNSNDCSLYFKDNINNDIGIDYLKHLAQQTANDELANFHTACILISGFIHGPYDRSGLFIDDSHAHIPLELTPIPSDLHTDKSYAQLMDETAQSYAGKNPIVYWSGGIDSTAVVASFVKNKIDFTLRSSEASKKECPFLHDYFEANYDFIHHDNHIFTLNNYNLNPNIMTLEQFGDLSIENRVIITGGDCNDQIIGSIQQSLVFDKLMFQDYAMIMLTIPGFSNVNEFYSKPISNSYKYMSPRDFIIERHSKIYECDTVVSANYYDSYLKPIIDKFPFKCEYAYQLFFFFNFIFRYQDHLNRLKRDEELSLNTFHAYFNTDDFQRWAVTNMDKNYEQYLGSYLTQKQFVKEYTYEVFKYDFILNDYKKPSIVHDRGYYVI